MQHQPWTQPPVTTMAPALLEPEAASCFPCASCGRHRPTSDGGCPHCGKSTGWAKCGGRECQPGDVAGARLVRSRVLHPLGQQYDLEPKQVGSLLVHAVILLGSAYHGYRRNQDSVAWGIAWAVGALTCPSVTAAFALSQGFAKGKGE